MGSNTFSTALKSVKEILDYNQKVAFSIPVYQRPYVWGEHEISNLLNDIYASYTRNPDSQYFIGNVYMYSTGDAAFDIIDGQQRFTTLWLIALVLKDFGITSGLTEFLAINNTPRLHFAIRDEVGQYLTARLGSRNVAAIGEESAFLMPVEGGIKIIKGKLNIIGEGSVPKINYTDFANYIYQKVVFVFNIAPENTDINALFVALGNSGLQLEQSDILKSKLLKKVTDKVKYAKIWEACENMNDYFERNVLAIFSKTDKSSLNEAGFREYNETFVFETSILETQQVQDLNEDRKIGTGKTISDIIKDEVAVVKDEVIKKEMVSRCRPIISFNLLLIHTLRLLNKQKGLGDIKKPFDKKFLIAMFEELDDENVECFFQLLWRVRYLFDKYVVKWRYDNDTDPYAGDGETLKLTSVSQHNTTFTRVNCELSELSVLQSTLYHTGGYNHQYWLTPFLHYLLHNDGKNGAEILEELEKIDNHMLPGEKKDISWKLTDQAVRHAKVTVNIQQILGMPSGTRFSHYWFYKLEYLLWKDWDRNVSNPAYEKFKRFRITAKNSVEHVFPQNQEHGEKLDDLKDGINWLDSFGNLGLLSVGQNSSYSHQDVKKKAIDFGKKETYDSLKLAKIYALPEKENWNSPQIWKHQEEMIAIIKKHYNSSC